MKKKKNRYTSRYNLGGKIMYQIGGVKDPNPGITALRKEAPEVVKKMGYGMGGMKKMYRGGGHKIKYQGGGMYTANQIPPGVGATAMTVYQESDPELQKQRELNLAQEVESQQASTTEFIKDLELSDAEAKQKVIDDALLEQQKTQQQTGVTKEVSKQLGEEIYGPGKGTDEFGNIINIKKVSDFKKDLIKSALRSPAA